MNTNKQKRKEKAVNLIWIDTQTGEQFHAGVAFYVENFGEYRLVLDAPRTVLYLRPTKLINGKSFYLVYAPVELNGNFSHRVEVGNGYSSDDTNNIIYMKIGRYSNQRLALLPPKGE